jgi:hypothetical protein
MKSSIEHRHTFDGDVEIQLTGSSVSITDSKARDSVSIHGIDALTLLKACRWFVTFYSRSHNDEVARQKATYHALKDLRRETDSQLLKLREELGDKVEA